MEISGKYNKAIVFTDNIEKEAISQIIKICNQKIFEGKKIRIMPDIHTGKGCVIGFTAELGDAIIPNLIGVDIGCGMLSVNLGRSDISFEKLDKFIINNIPFGFKKNRSADENQFPNDFLNRLKYACKSIDENYYEHLKVLGTLGGGNHFIEVGMDLRKNRWLFIHSGSRNFGLKIAVYFQNIAKENKKEIKIEKELEYLQEKHMKDYIEHMKIAQEYASRNRTMMANKILDYFEIESTERFETIHNYIDFKDNIIRKGAISEKKDEKVLIPLNMLEGSILAIGKGNSNWNFSAPHGAGRKMSRSKAKLTLDLEYFKKSMENIWTTSVSKKTLDEAPQAYKSKNEILAYINETVEIVDIIKPLYNFKAH